MHAPVIVVYQSHGRFCYKYSASLELTVSVMVPQLAEIDVRMHQVESRLSDSPAECAQLSNDSLPFTFVNFGLTSMTEAAFVYPRTTKSAFPSLLVV